MNGPVVVVVVAVVVTTFVVVATVVVLIPPKVATVDMVCNPIYWCRNVGTPPTTSGVEIFVGWIYLCFVQVYRENDWVGCFVLFHVCSSMEGFFFFGWLICASVGLEGGSTGM